jgi:bifunctional non-homologous end joining protein LigD
MTEAPQENQLGPQFFFDLIELDGDDLRALPIETRKATLASLLRKSVALRLSEHLSADGPQVFAHACKLGAEGIVSKALPTAPARTRHG